MSVFPLLVSLCVFFACVGLWPTRATRFREGWAAERLRQRFRSQARRARLRTSI